MAYEIDRFLKIERAIVIGTEQRARKVGSVEILPWREFLKQLWQGMLLT